MRETVLRCYRQRNRADYSRKLGTFDVQNEIVQLPVPDLSPSQCSQGCRGVTARAYERAAELPTASDRLTKDRGRVGTDGIACLVSDSASGSIEKR